MSYQYMYGMSPPPDNPHVKGIRCIVLVPHWGTQLLNVTMESIKLNSHLCNMCNGASTE